MDDDDGAAGALAGGRRGSSASAKRGRSTGTGAMSAGGAEPAPWGQPPQQQQLGSAASRIYRVKASGGKDRHSKVYTSKGVRDRRVRLSVPTAIAFYDLQDRLGFDQPSKAVEWLINAAAAAIDQLPPLDPAAFAAAMPTATDQPAQAAATPRAASNQQQQQQSWCSSTSETSKGSELSLSRSDGRDKEVTVASASPAQAAASFTELLTGAGGAADQRHSSSSWQQQHQHHQQPAAAAHTGKAGAQVVPTYPGFRFGNAPPVGMVPAQPFNFNFATTTPAQMAHFSLVQNPLAPAPDPAPPGDYSLDFSMSSGFQLGANRGTLQSNSQSHFSSHQLQELDDGPSPPFLYDQNTAAAAAPDNHHQLTATAALQLWNGFRHSAMKEKAKN